MLGNCDVKRNLANNTDVGDTVLVGWSRVNVA